MTFTESIHLASEDKLRVSLVVAGGILILLVFAWALSQLLKFAFQWLDRCSAHRNNHIVQSRGDAYPTEDQINDWDRIGDELKRQRNSRRPPQDSEPTLPGAA